MANNYSQFSEYVTFETAEQRDWFIERLDFDAEDYCDPEDAEDGDTKTHDSPLYIEMTELGVDDCTTFSGIRAETEGELDLWVCSEEGGDLSALATLVAHYQRVFGIKTPWGASGSSTCSRPRVGEFGGFACFVHLGKQEWIDTWSWVEGKEKEAKDA